MADVKIKAVIVDIDGTISNCDHRLKYIETKPADWDTFFKSCVKDSPNRGVIEWVNAIAASGISVILVSGRRVDTREDTRRWLRAHGVNYQFMFMPRDLKDYRPDTEIKQGCLADIQKVFDVLFVIADRPTVVEMWRRNGLKVYPVFQERWENASA